MEPCKRKMCCLQFFCFVLIGLFALETYASSGTVFYESFDESFEESWIVSENKDYLGVWNHSKSLGHDDYGLLVSEQARKYAIAKELNKPVELNDGTIVLQFEARLQNGLECGGAYLKFLRPQESGWTPKAFDNKSPYSIMFGPDRCGGTNKVHFIINHKNPKTGKYVEHHLISPPLVPSDKMSHVYTAILKPDSEVVILLDGVERKKANFMSPEAFRPSLIPPKTIPDPEDKKPEDWDDDKTIPDPDAKKPEDWDENAPMEILDEEAKKPEGWLDDEPEEIDDPEAVKPEDWDDEEDGEWEAPKIDNPKCESAPGCGEWKRPMKRNPEYKGKWYAPLIDNPNYMGVWKPREIANVEYFELDKPNLEPIVAIGIEIWTMQDGILFDNILIASDEKTAESVRDATWKPKFLVEKANLREEEQAASIDGLKGIQKSVFDVLYKIADLPILGDHKMKVMELIEEAEKKPTIIVGIIISLAVVIVSPLLKILLAIKKKPGKVNAAPKKEAGKVTTTEVGEDASAPRKRNTRRDG
ncbi:putative calreticulin/calnexin, concanavalin A-like lectin/glucanase domain superfamily [Helianthus annuus]|nr:putative calreticulin/calnexin, concanavalin A-like lectin/glucanase domain superfamily [Helianthus annuus]